MNPDGFAAIKLGRMVPRPLDPACSICDFLYLDGYTCARYPNGIPEKFIRVRILNTLPDNGCEHFLQVMESIVSKISKELENSLKKTSFRTKLIDEIFINLHSIYRMHVFLDICKYLSDKEYWYVLRHYYCWSDFLYGLSGEIKKAFQSPRKHKDLLIDSESRNFLNKLPPTVTIHRVMSEKEYENRDFGVSWTLKKNRAVLYKHGWTATGDPNERKGNKIISSLKIPKEKIIGYWNDRSEHEVIYIHEPCAPRKIERRVA